MTFENLIKHGFKLTYNDVMRIVNAACVCGGGDGLHPKPCVACAIWHAMVRAMGVEE